MMLLKALLIFIFSISSVAQDCLFNNDYVQVGNQLVFPSKHLEREGCFAWVQVSRRDDDFEPHTCKTALPEAADISHPPNTVYNVEDVIIPRETLNRLFQQNIPAHYITGLSYIKSVKTVDIHYRGRKSVTHVSMKNVSNCQGIFSIISRKNKCFPLAFYRNPKNSAFYYELITDDGTEEPYVSIGTLSSYHLDTFLFIPCLFQNASVNCLEWDYANRRCKTCVPPFEGYLCEKTKGKGTCKSSCLYGVCSDEDKCKCMLGYTGAACETLTLIFLKSRNRISQNIPFDQIKLICLVIGACQSSPCKHGKCKSISYYYVCECDFPYKGFNCDTEIDLCENITCIHGKCISHLYENGSYAAYCNCDEGYTGSDCSTDINECSDIANPVCLNNGKCVNEVGSYKCICPIRFDGRNCEFETDMCTPNPCQNNASCVTKSELKDGFECLCSDIFTGKTCETRIDFCQGITCMYGGTCSNLNEGGYECLCKPMLSGKHCEKIDPCRSSPCSNQATCITLSDDLEEYECKCRIGFEGRLCEKKIDYCKNVMCANGGECINTDDNNYICKCKTGFSGRHCEEIRICDLVSCIHGTCKYDLFENGDYVSFCNCNPGYQGKDCSIDIDECADKVNYPCLNNGTCFNDIGSYHCECSVKFEGERCEKKIDPCRSSPCSNQATCITLSDDLEEYECKCRIGFEGRLCEK
ncbi:Fibropellin-1, partial [Trichinella nelsoni]